jgi:hypothetical protein
MKTDRDILRRIENLYGPKHLFILPRWADPVALDRLIQGGYLTVSHLQRSEEGDINLVMGMQLTNKGARLLEPAFSWSQLALRGSLAGASFTGMSLAILYLG